MNYISERELKLIVKTSEKSGIEFLIITKNCGSIFELEKFLRIFFQTKKQSWLFLYELLLIRKTLNE